MNILQDNQRRYMRVAFDCPTVYCTQNGNRLEAHCVDVGRGGLCIQVDEPVEKGSTVLVYVDPESVIQAPFELKARVAWTQPVPDSNAMYVGVKAYHDEPDVLWHLGRCMAAAVLKADASLMKKAMEVHVVLPQNSNETHQPQLAGV